MPVADTYSGMYVYLPPFRHDGGIGMIWLPTISLSQLLITLSKVWEAVGT